MIRGKNNLITFSLIFLLFFTNTTLVSANIQEDMDSLSLEIKNFIADDSLSFVIGSKISKAEKTSYKILKEIYSNYTLTEYNDSINLTSIKGTIVLLGIENRNKAFEQVKNSFEHVKTRNTTGGKIIFYNNTQKQKAIVFSDHFQGKNYERDLSKSPLAKFMPVEFIPVVATTMSLLMLWLIKFLIPFGKKVLRLFLAGKVMGKIKKKSIKEEFKGFEIHGIKVKYREWISIFLSAIVFALTLSFYTFFKDGIIVLILSAITVNSIVYFIRNFARLLLDKKHQAQTEYYFWWWGAIVTVISGWLGNTFSLAGYIMSDGKKDKKTEGKVQYIINLYSFIFALIFIVLNIIWPMLFFQMSANLLLFIGFLQMIPISPFSGLTIMKHNKIKWSILFIAMLIVYSGFVLWV
jgi:hypothetical protein